MYDCLETMTGCHVRQCLVDMDGKFHIHGKPGFRPQLDVVYQNRRRLRFRPTKTNKGPKSFKRKKKETKE